MSEARLQWANPNRVRGHVLKIIIDNPAKKNS